MSMSESVMRSWAALVMVVGFVLACSDAKKSASVPPTETTSEAVQSKAKAVVNDSHASALAPPVMVIERTSLATRATKTRDGQELLWKQMDGIEVQDESFRKVYESRGKTYISYKADVRAKKNCLLRWRVELIDGAAGRGKSVAKISGRRPIAVGDTIIVSGVIDVANTDAEKIASASAGFWTVCDDAMPTVTAHQFKITETKATQLKFGTAFDLHHTSFQIAGRAKPNSRCFFDIVAEDIDVDGYTLNRDFATFSVGSARESATSHVKLRRTTFEGGSEKDYVERIKGKRSYLRKVSCVGPLDTKATPKSGIEVTKLQLHAHTGEATSAEHLVRKSYQHSAGLRNTIGRDCAFRIRYRILDTAGIPMNKVSFLSEVLHLKKGADLQYRSKDERLFVWLDQVDEVGSLVVEHSAPINECKTFDVAKAL